MRWIRFLITMVRSSYRSRLRITDAPELSFRVWLTDIDVSIMNHAALMTVMETGRIDFMVRTGFFSLARKNGWYFPSSCIQVQFFRPLKLFQKAILQTRVFYMDASRIYIEQKVMREGRIMASCVVKSTVKKGREQLDILDILQQLKIGEPPSGSVDLVEALERTNALVKERLNLH